MSSDFKKVGDMISNQKSPPLFINICMFFWSVTDRTTDQVSYMVDAH